MGKRLGMQIEQAVKQELSKRKVLKLKIGGEEYEVRFKYRLSIEDKNKIVQDIADLMLEFKDKYPEIIPFTIATLQNLTDLDFPEKSEQKVSFVSLLADGELLQKIFEEIPEQIMKDLVGFIETTNLILPEMIKEMELQSKE